ncbi:sodium:solute symporter [Methylocystis sp. ATCC 49242]|uniref:sodium:solute symporter n=1 Tax=Methylocystis sp. ATCC 49242 TaxID=622637 RepID=UPI0001F86D0A|nr:sodium:solute symporter [Methylocystis sp. ATCC 49242]
MSDRPSEAALFDRANLDARITFVSASFLLAYGFAALLDRVGAPERFVGAAPPWFTIVALAALGFLLHSMRVSVYYAAGRAVPAAYSGFANAAIVIAMVTPFATRLAGRSWTLGVVGGVFLGLATAAFYLGPLLRKTGAFSISGLLAARFPSAAPRFGVIAAVALSSGLLAIAGGLIAVDALVDLTGAGRTFAAFAIAAATLVIAGPGGLAGAIWTAAAAGGVALFGLGLPLFALGVRGELPVNILGGGPGWREAAELLSAWRIVPAPMNLLIEIGATIAVALGVATLAPTLAPAVTTNDLAAARRSGFATFGWSIFFALMVGGAVAASAIEFAGATAGQPPERLPPPVYAASKRGLVEICGATVRNPSEAQRACVAQGLAPGAPLNAADVRPMEGVYLLGALPGASGLGAAAAGLLASGLIALGLALAATGLQTCATAVGHDALYRLRGEIDLTSRRLAITRLVLIVVSALGYVVGATHIVSPSVLVSLALSISAACVAPAVAMAFWPRAGDREALVALIGGVIGLVAALAAAAAARRVEIYALAALAGATLGLAMGVVSGLSTEPEKPGAREFIRRVLRGDGQVMAPDKGA